MAARCPFSNLEPVTTRTGYDNLQYSFDAPRAGGRYCTRQGFRHLVEKVGKLGEKGKARVVTLLVDKRRAGEEEPELTIDLIRQAEVKPDLSVEECAGRLLRYFVAESDGRPGSVIDVSGEKVEQILAWIESTSSPDPLLAWRIESKMKGAPCIPQEVRVLCAHLRAEGLIELGDEGSTVSVTVSGYSKVSRMEEEEVRASSISEGIVVGEKTDSRRVFVVHGHDVGARETVARYLENLGLEAVILDEQASQGRTVIEKFEEEADVAFAVVLFTPDDVGYPKGKVEEKKPRARQNVVLELGFFIRALGRKRVCVLHKGGVEFPSDYRGVVYIELDDSGGWRQAVGKELRHAGVEVDLNRIR